MVNGIHHLNLLVRDIDAAIDRYTQLLGGVPLRETLPQRGVATARFRLGDTWFVLVQPTTADGPVARHLAEHGEGLFLVSFGVDELESACARAQTNGLSTVDFAPRDGLDGWRVADLFNDGSTTVQLTAATTGV